jgi:hypothetical protein
LKKSHQSGIVCRGKQLTLRGAVISLAEVGQFAHINQGGYMAISDILASIDCDIVQLQQARALLSGGAAPTAKKTAGRLKKVVAAPKKAAKKKRNISSEGRKRIVEAVKKRWAAKKAAATK